MNVQNAVIAEFHATHRVRCTLYAHTVHTCMTKYVCRRGHFRPPTQNMHQMHARELAIGDGYSNASVSPNHRTETRRDETTRPGASTERTNEHPLGTTSIHPLFPRAGGLHSNRLPTRPSPQHPVACCNVPPPTPTCAHQSPPCPRTNPPRRVTPLPSRPPFS